METASLNVPSYTSLNKSFNNNQTIFSKHVKAPRKPPRKDSAEYFEHYPDESQDVLERLPNDIFDDFEGQDTFLLERRKSDMDIFDDIHRHLEEKGLFVSDSEQQRRKMIPEIDVEQKQETPNDFKEPVIPIPSDSNAHNEHDEMSLNIVITKDGVVVSNVENNEKEISTLDVSINENGGSCSDADDPEYRDTLISNTDTDCTSNVDIKRNDTFTSISDSKEIEGLVSHVCINGNVKLEEQDELDILDTDFNIENKVISPPNGIKSGDDTYIPDKLEKTAMVLNVNTNSTETILDSNIDKKSPEANNLIQPQHITKSNGTHDNGEVGEPIKGPLLEESSKTENPSYSLCSESNSTRTSESSSPEEPDIDERKMALQKSILWLRQELMEMRKTDQTLIMQLMNIQMKIHSLKTEVFNSPPVSRRQLMGDFQLGSSSRRPSEEFFMDVVEEDLLESENFEEDTELADVEEENGEPVAWREFQRRLSCRRTFSKRGKLPGIIRKTSTTSEYGD